jgi:hypothetical protein
MTGQPLIRRPAWGQTYKIGWLEILDLVNYSSVNVLENLGRPLVPSVICQQCQHPMIQAQLINKPANRSILLESKVAAFSDPNTIPNSLTIRQSLVPHQWANCVLCATGHQLEAGRRGTNSADEGAEDATSRATSPDSDQLGDLEESCFYFVFQLNTQHTPVRQRKP